MIHIYCSSDYNIIEHMLSNTWSEIALSWNWNWDWHFHQSWYNGERVKVWAPCWWQQWGLPGRHTERRAPEDTAPGRGPGGRCSSAQASRIGLRGTALNPVKHQCHMLILMQTIKEQHKLKPGLTKSLSQVNVTFAEPLIPVPVLKGFACHVFMVA